MAVEYHNPLGQAVGLSPSRIDEGVDYGTGGGEIVAIADGRVQLSTLSPSGWPGAYISYTINLPGPLDGAVIYQAEGIIPDKANGETVRGGDRIAVLLSGASIEIGFGSHNPPNSWAREYGSGYDQVNSTGAGLLFNQLLMHLGAPSGHPEGHQLGRRPTYRVDDLSSPISGHVSIGQLLTQYNPSTIIRHDFYQLGVHGRRAFQHANQIRALVGKTRHCTMKGH